VEWIVAVCRVIEAELGESRLELLYRSMKDLIRNREVLARRDSIHLDPSFIIADQGKSKLNLLRYFVVQTGFDPLWIYWLVSHFISAISDVLQFIVALVVFFEEFLGRLLFILLHIGMVQ